MLISPVLLLRHLSRPSVPHSRRGIFLVTIPHSRIGIPHSRTGIPHSRTGIFLLTNHTVSIKLSPSTKCTCRHYSTEEGRREGRTAKRPIKEASIKENKSKSCDDERIPDTNNPSDWETIYKFNQIKTAKFMCRVKVYQTGLTVFFASSSLYAYFGAYFGEYFDASSNLEGCLNTTTICVFACVMLYIFGNIFNKMIGFAYVSREDGRKWIKLSHLTFWGRRRNIKMPVEDLLPLPSDSSTATLYQVMYQHSDPKIRFILPLRFATIYDPQQFERCFKINLDRLQQ